MRACVRVCKFVRVRVCLVSVLCASVFSFSFHSHIHTHMHNCGFTHATCREAKKAAPKKAPLPPVPEPAAPARAHDARASSKPAASTSSKSGTRAKDFGKVDHASFSYLKVGSTGLRGLAHGCGRCWLTRWLAADVVDT